MQFIKRNIIVVLVAAIALASCSREAKVIPRKTMTKIFVDMFEADAWLGVQDQDMLKRTDTTAFYEPIFNKYGFTLEDYLKSVDYYLNDPERFSKVVAKSTAILKERQEALEAMTGQDQEEGSELDAESSSPDSTASSSKRRARKANAKVKGNEGEGEIKVLDATGK